MGWRDKGVEPKTIPIANHYSITQHKKNTYILRTPGDKGACVEHPLFSDFYLGCGGAIRLLLGGQDCHSAVAVLVHG
jgi:hypothetical protein